MIDRKTVVDIVDNLIKDTDAFIVDVRVSPGNDIVVELDSPSGIDLQECVELTRRFEEQLDRDVEDYQLEIGTAGFTAPFKVVGQYLKNVGNEVDVLTRDGRKLTGVLTAVDPDGGTFTVNVTKRVKEPGKKRPVNVEEALTFAMDDVKQVCYHFTFK